MAFLHNQVLGRVCQDGQLLESFQRFVFKSCVPFQPEDERLQSFLKATYRTLEHGCVDVQFCNRETLEARRREVGQKAVGRVCDFCSTEDTNTRRRPSGSRYGGISFRVKPNSRFAY